MLIVGLIIALLPAVVCACVLAAARAWRSDAEARLAWAVPLAIGAGFIGAQLMVDGAPRLPPIEASGWFSLVAAALMVVAIAVRPRVHGPMWAVVSAIATLAMVVVIVHPLVGGAWSLPAAVAWILGMTLVAAVVALAVDRHAAAGPGTPVVFLVAATGIAAGLTLCGSARYGQLAGTIASAMGPLVLLGFVRRDRRVLAGAAWMSYLILAMLLVAGIAYVDVPVIVGLLAALAPLGVLAGDLPPLRGSVFWKRDGVRVVVTGALVAIALAVALASAGDSGGY